SATLVVDLDNLFCPDPQISVTKVADPTTYNAAGQIINYTIQVTNTGNVNLGNITVVDPLTGMNESIGLLAPGAFQTFNTSYTIQPADLTLDSLPNIVTASGTGNAQTVTDRDTAVVNVFALPPCVSGNVTNASCIGVNDGAITLTVGCGVE